VHWPGGRELFSNLNQIERHFTELYSSVVKPNDFYSWMVDVRSNLYAIPTKDAVDDDYVPDYLKVHWNPPVIEHTLEHLDDYIEQWQDTEQTMNNKWLQAATLSPLTVHEIKRWPNFGTGVFKDTKGMHNGDFRPWGCTNPTDGQMLQNSCYFGPWGCMNPSDVTSECSFN
jgi:hypothetical protein